jgi:O-acetylhomoserine (thiol)-lyase
VTERPEIDRTETDRTFGFRTRSLHAGGQPDPTTGARAVPIYQTTSFVFDDAQDAATLFALQKYGNIYSRIGNPTVAALEERIASLEGGLGAVATSSGQAAEFLTFAALAGAGDHIVASSALYGGTVTQLDVTLRRFGVDTTFVTSDDPAEFAAAIRPTTKLVFTEVVSNPSCAVADLAGLAEVAHAAGVPLVVDATTVTPFLCRPIEHGADVVIHSATKFLGGHGTTLGGLVVDAGTFDWGNGRFPTMTEPVPAYGDVTWWGNFGEYGFLTKLRVEQLRDIGPALSPHSAFLLLQGVETLAQRMTEHVANARRVAEWLRDDPRVAWVSYAGLPGHPHHERAARYTPLGPGAVFSFGIRGGREAGERFIDSVQLLSHLANIGDARTLVIHPASTTHQQLNADQLEAAGVPADLVRISVGLEDVDDILWDIDQALDAATTGAAP